MGGLWIKDEDEDVVVMELELYDEELEAVVEEGNLSGVGDSGEEESDD